MMKITIFLLVLAFVAFTAAVPLEKNDIEKDGTDAGPKQDETDPATMLGKLYKVTIFQILHSMTKYVV